MLGFETQQNLIDWHMAHQGRLLAVVFTGVDPGACYAEEGNWICSEVGLCRWHITPPPPPTPGQAPAPSTHPPPHPTPMPRRDPPPPPPPHPQEFKYCNMSSMRECELSGSSAPAQWANA